MHFIGFYGYSEHLIENKFSCLKKYFYICTYFECKIGNGLATPFLPEKFKFRTVPYFGCSAEFFVLREPSQGYRQTEIDVCPEILQVYRQSTIFCGGIAWGGADLIGWVQKRGCENAGLGENPGRIHI